VVVNFLIADTFTDSLAWLTGDEQKPVKTTAFDLQMDPSTRVSASTNGTRRKTSGYAGGRRGFQGRAVA
jgi:hypothetical protein